MKIGDRVASEPTISQIRLHLKVPEKNRDGGGCEEAWAGLGVTLDRYGVDLELVLDGLS